MSSDTGRLCGGMSLIPVSSRSIATIAGLTINMWARPDLDQSQQESRFQKGNTPTHPDPRAGLRKDCPIPLTEYDPPSCLRRNVPSSSERGMLTSLVAGVVGSQTYTSSYSSFSGGGFLIARLSSSDSLSPVLTSTSAVKIVNTRLNWANFWRSTGAGEGACWGVLSPGSEGGGDAASGAISGACPEFPPLAPYTLSATSAVMQRAIKGNGGQHRTNIAVNRPPTS